MIKTIGGAVSLRHVLDSKPRHEAERRTPLFTPQQRNNEKEVISEGNDKRRVFEQISGPRSKHGDCRKTDAHLEIRGLFKISENLESLRFESGWKEKHEHQARNSTKIESHQMTRSSRSSRPKKPLKNPRGGLTAAGRVHFKKKEGAHLRPGATGKADTARTLCACMGRSGPEDKGGSEEACGQRDITSHKV